MAKNPITEEKIVMKQKEKMVYEKVDPLYTTSEIWEFLPEQFLWKAGPHKFYFLAHGSQLVFKTENHIILRIYSTCPSSRDRSLQAQIYVVKNSHESQESEESEDSEEDYRQPFPEYEIFDNFFLTPGLDPNEKITATHEIPMLPISFVFSEKLDVLKAKELKKRGLVSSTLFAWLLH